MSNILVDIQGEVQGLSAGSNTFYTSGNFGGFGLEGYLRKAPGADNVYEDSDYGVWPEGDLISSEILFKLNINGHTYESNRWTAVTGAPDYRLVTIDFPGAAGLDPGAYMTIEFWRYYNTVSFGETSGLYGTYTSESFATIGWDTLSSGVISGYMFAKCEVAGGYKSTYVYFGHGTSGSYAGDTRFAGFDNEVGLVSGATTVTADSSTVSCLQVPSGVSASYLTGGVDLEWNNCGSGSTYTLETSVNSGAYSELVTQTEVASGHTYRYTVPTSAASYQFRVKNTDSGLSGYSPTYTYVLSFVNADVKGRVAYSGVTYKGGGYPLFGLFWDANGGID